MPDDDAAKILGAALREHRIRQGISLRALARQLGLSAHGTLVDYEHGRRILPQDLTLACERVLHVDDGQLQHLRREALAARAGARSTALLGMASPPDPALADHVPGQPPRTTGPAPLAPAPEEQPTPLAPAPEQLAPGANRRRLPLVRHRLLALGVAVVLAAAATFVAVARHGDAHGSPKLAAATGRLRFGFETPKDNWGLLWGFKQGHGSVTDSLHYEGRHAYEVVLRGPSAGTGPGHGYVAFGTTHGLKTLHSGMRVTVHMWTSYPADGVRFFVYAPGSVPVWAPETPDNGSELPVSGGTTWSTLTFTVPPVPVVGAIGVQPYARDDQVRVVAIDAVSW